MTVKRRNLIALLSALCFFFSTIEFMIPKPLPFLRLGLANLPILLGIELLTVPQLALVVLIKVLGQGLIGGTLFSYIFLFSAVGTIASALVMIFLKKLFRGWVSFAGTSVAGALTSNLAQLALAYYFVFGPAAWLIGPPFLALGTVTSLALGLFTNYFTKHSLWYPAAKSAVADFAASGFAVTKPVGDLGDVADADVAARGSAKNLKGRVSPLVFFVVGLLILVALLFSPDVRISAAIFCGIVILVLCSRQRIRVLPALVMSLSIVVFNLLSPGGKVLFSIGSFPVTLGALEIGIKKALVLEGMIFLSRWMIRPQLKLPGSFGALVSQSFMVLERLTEQKGVFDRKHLVRSLDTILFSVTQQEKSADGADNKTKAEPELS